MRATTRLQKLERVIPAWRPENLPPPQTDEEWVTFYEECMYNRVLGLNEPEFPKAVEYCRRAVDAANDYAARPRKERSKKVTEQLAAAVRQGFTWITETLMRQQDGLPAVSESEFGELAAWFERNRKALERLEATEPLKNADGNDITVLDTAKAVKRGARKLGAGYFADWLRFLQAQFGDTVDGRRRPRNDIAHLPGPRK